MAVQTIEITVTLHWRLGDREQSGVASLTDSIPQDLIPLLVEGCELPTVHQDNTQITYELRLGTEQRPALHLTQSLSTQGVRTGSHLWLVPTQQSGQTAGYHWISLDKEQSAKQQVRCILRLPDGSETVIPSRGQDLIRAWLLDVLKLYHPQEYERELKLGSQSAYRFVSNRRPHCTVRFLAEGYWVVVTNRDDVETTLNGHRLKVDRPEPINTGDRIQLGGSSGPTAEVILL